MSWVIAHAISAVKSETPQPNPKARRQVGCSSVAPGAPTPTRPGPEDKKWPGQPPRGEGLAGPDLGRLEQQAGALRVAVAEASAAPQEKWAGDLEPDARFVGSTAAVGALVVSGFVTRLGRSVLRHVHDDLGGLLPLAGFRRGR